MPFKVILFILFTQFCYCNLLYAQQLRAVSGIVQDSSGTALAGAGIQLLSASDTLKVSTGSDGRFFFNQVTSDAFTLNISSLGYSTYTAHYAFKDSRRSMELAPVVLRPGARLLPEVVVKAAVQAVTFKKDTTEYDADAFMPGRGASVEDLLRQLPGIEVDKDGNVTSGGNTLSLLRVNGHNFFGGNLQEFIKQLPADLLSKLQVIDDYGDEANFTGVRTGEPRKLLNLVTKPGMDRGKFGNAAVNAGTNKRFGTSLNGNYWQGAKQLSANTSLNTAGNTGAVSTANRTGLTYANDLSKKLGVNAAYAYSTGRSRYSGNTYSETINPLGTIFNSSSSTNSNHSFTHAVNTGVNYHPDARNFLNIAPAFTYSRNVLNSGLQSVQTGIIRQDLENNNASRQGGPAVSGYISSGHRFKKPGRNISASLSVNNNQNQGTNGVKDQIAYFNGAGQHVQDSVLNRLISTDNRSAAYLFNTSYSEPLSKKMHLDFTYTLNVTNNRNILSTSVTGPGGETSYVDSLSTASVYSFITQRVAASYRYTGQKLNASLGSGLQTGLLHGRYENKEQGVNNRIGNISPTANINYILSKNNALAFNYSGNSVAPTYSQLQPVPDNRNLQNILVGNPDLKPAFNHRTGMSFRHNSPKSQNILMLGLGGSWVQNQIVANTLLRKDTLGGLRQETHYVNVSGTYSLNSNYSYSVPYSIAGKKARINLDGNMLYASGVSLADNVKNYSENLNFSQALRSGLYLKHISLNFTSRYSRNYSRYTLGGSRSSRVQNWQFNLNSSLTPVKKLNLNIDAGKQFNSGYKGVSANNPFMLNAYAQYYLLKKNMASMSLQCYDLLNQGSNFSRSVSDNAIIENRTRYVSRYFVFSLSLQMSRFGKQEEGGEAKD